GLLAGLLLVVQRAALLEQVHLFSLQPADLLDEILKLAIENRQLAAEGSLLVGILRQPPGEFDLARIELINRVAQVVLSLLQRLGLLVSSIQLRGKIGDATIGIG